MQHACSDYESLFVGLKERFGLNERQADQLKRYAFLLIEWNKKFNLTAILDINKIVHYHFYDSLYITDFIDFNAVKSISDIGTGAGFPGMPLKIAFPHLKVTLIEVNSKKRAFLEYLVAEFGLQEVTIIGDDWRTFLRSSLYPIDYFFARASLQPEELVRVFKPSCFYRDATLVYWAAAQWVSGKQEESFVKKEMGYTIDGIQRKYVFLQKT